jgi:hypothetical protein
MGAYERQAESADCDGDGLPDECEADCDRDGVADECAIAAGQADDCNGNGVPDSCEVATAVHLESGPMTPIGVDSPQTFVLDDARHTRADVTITLHASADLDDVVESIAVAIENVPIGLTAGGAGLCSDPPDAFTFSEPADLWNVLDNLATILHITLTTTTAVSSSACGGASYVAVTIDHLTEGAADRNANGVVDECETDR